MFQTTFSKERIVNMDYFKILNTELNQYGFQYKEGLNVDYPTKKNRGLYFADKDHILGYLEIGTVIAKVTVPSNVDIHIQKEGVMYADAIILSDIMDIWNIDNFKKLVEEWCINISKYGNWLVDIARMEGVEEISNYIKEKQNMKG